MGTMLSATLKGIFRDRVFQGILATALLFLFIPTAASLSMRQVTELSITLSLSLISFILLLLAVFLGGTALWRDMERRYTYSVLGLPITRGAYLTGKFGATALFLLLTSLVLGGAAFVAVFSASGIYPPSRPVVWNNLLLAIVFDALKYILLVAFAFLFGTVSTSFFLPVFGTIAVFLVGSASQGAYDYTRTTAGQALSPFAKQAAGALYYLLPNFSAFDLKVQAVYGLALPGRGLLLTLLYFLVYAAILLALSVLSFSLRELK